MRYAVAHGRRSGRGGAAGLGREAVRALRSAGHEVEDLVAGSLPQARVLAAAAVARGVDVLVVAGGDGVVSLATDLCAGTGTAVAVLPAGTGNDAARSLGIPRGRAGALATLATGEVRTVDTLHLAQLDRHVLGSVPAGLDARIADRANRWPRALRIGAATYSLSALVEIALLPGRPPLRYRLTVDGVSDELEALVVVPANLSHYGGGLPIAPDADPADGLLDLVVIGPVGPAAAVGLLRAVRAGRHTEHPAVRITRARQVHLEGPADVVAQGDGEPLGPLPLTVTVAPAALRVLVPGLS